MLNQYEIRENRIEQSTCESAPILVYTDPTEAERRHLVETYKIDEHMLGSALDPDEQARLDFDPGYLGVVYKRPKNLSAEDRLFFRVGTAGLFLTGERLIVIVQDPLDVFHLRHFRKVCSLRDVMLRIMAYSITHFLEHIKVITMISDELEQKIQGAMENKYLLNLFSLEKSMVYYSSALATNTALIEKLRVNAGRYGFGEAEHEFLEDMSADSNQALRQAEMYANILASLMDARASIVANNLNGIMKVLSLITVGIMTPNIVVSIFSMNVLLPFSEHNPYAFWLILLLMTCSVGIFLLMKKKMGW